MDGKEEFPPGKQGSGSHCHPYPCVVAASCGRGRGQVVMTGGSGDVDCGGLRWLKHWSRRCEADPGNRNQGHIVIPIQNFGDVEVPSLTFFFLRTNRVILGYSRAYPCWPSFGLVWLLSCWPADCCVLFARLAREQPKPTH